MTLFLRNGIKNLKGPTENENDLKLSHRQLSIIFTNTVLRKLDHNYLLYNKVFGVLNIFVTGHPNYLHRIINRIHTAYIFSYNLQFIPHIWNEVQLYVNQIFKNSILYETSKI